MSRFAHFFVAVIGLGSMLFILRLLRTRQLRAKYTLLWLSIGSVMVVLSISPKLLDLISDWIGISYAPATLFMTAIVMLLLICVHFSWEISRLEERARILAEEVAILRHDLETR